MIKTVLHEMAYFRRLFFSPSTLNTWDVHRFDGPLFFLLRHALFPHAGTITDGYIMTSNTCEACPSRIETLVFMRGSTQHDEDTITVVIIVSIGSIACMLW